MKLSRLLFLANIACLISSAGIAEGASFTPISPLQPGQGLYAYGISPDGSVVVGQTLETPVTPRVFAWTRAAGIVLLDPPAGGSFPEAQDVASGGTVVVGYGFVDTSESAIRWTPETGALGIGVLPVGTGSSFAAAVTPDGSVIVGGSAAGAFRWTEVDGMNSIGGGRAFGVSADGSVVVGELASGGAFRWTAAEGIEPLPNLPDAIIESASIAFDVSADGDVIVGYAFSGAGRPGTGHLVRWVNGTIEDLGALSGGAGARAASADGSTIVGNGGEAIVWVEGTGIRSIRDLLVADFGLDLGDWELWDATDVSADGRTIVGVGRRLSEPTLVRSWVAVIPEPASGALLLVGVLASALLRARCWRP